MTMVEWVLFIYFFVSVCAILFNATSVFILRFRDNEIRNYSIMYSFAIEQELQCLRIGSEIHASHFKLLRKGLKSSERFLSYDEALQTFYQEEPDIVREYLRIMRPLYDELARVYLESETTNVTFFLGFANRYQLFLEKPPDESLVPLIFQALKSPSIYCREKAFETIGAFKDPEMVLRALRVLNQIPYYQNGHVLTEGLSTYPGDKKELNAVLWASYTNFDPAMQMSILNYFRFTTGDMKDEFLSLLTDPDTDSEICFCAIRYFGRYPDPRAYPLLLDFADESRHAKWEYSIIASTVLGSYPGEETVARLSKNLCSRNWFIRFNAASSLVQLHIDLEKLLETLDAGEKYGREILQYHIDKDFMKKTAV